jgi:hypothetical protein
MLRAIPVGKIAMSDAEIAALLRAVLDEPCASVSPSDASTRMTVASTPRGTAEQGKSLLDDSKRAGREALRQPPTMWR